MSKKIIPKIIITSGYHWNYYQWFILGFYELEKQKKIKIKFKLPFASQMLTLVSSDVIAYMFRKLQNITETNDYNLRGEIIFEDGSRKKFVIDCADAPFLFAKEDLDVCNCYFKMQYPIDLDNGEDHFNLTTEIAIPWCDHKHEDKSLPVAQNGKREVIDLNQVRKNKIYPLMIGARQLAKAISYRALKAGYQNYLKDRCTKKEMPLMCYFGNAKGPMPKKSVSFENIDYDREDEIVGLFAEEIEHPNVKRGKVADYIAASLENSDARVIDRGFSDCSGSNRERVIPLKDFCKHVSKFEYNINISGYRLSIPNRFIESFIVGTAIITDRLHVKWYKPFGEEVIETVEMGYYKDNQVDWKTFEEDMKHLPHNKSEIVIKNFETKWKPEVVAQYIIDTVRNN